MHNDTRSSISRSKWIAHFEKISLKAIFQNWRIGLTVTNKQTEWRHTHNVIFNEWHTKKEDNGHHEK